MTNKTAPDIGILSHTWRCAMRNIAPDSLLLQIPQGIITWQARGLEPLSWKLQTSLSGAGWSDTLFLPCYICLPGYIINRYLYIYNVSCFQFVSSFYCKRMLSCVWAVGDPIDLAQALLCDRYMTTSL